MKRSSPFKFPKFERGDRALGTDERAIIRSLTRLEKYILEVGKRLSGNTIRIDIDFALKGSPHAAMLAQNLSKVRQILTTRSDEIVQPATSLLQSSIVSRATVHPIEAQSGGSSTIASEPLLEKIVAVLRAAPQKIGPGRYGFGDIQALDAIKMTSRPKSRDRTDTGKPKKLSDYSDTQREAATRDIGSRIVSRSSAPGDRYTTSPFNTAWKIIEFGTGVFADDRLKTVTGYAKVPGGGGAWYWNPLQGSPVILGQVGAHFLIPHRSNVAAFADDEAMVSEFILDYVMSLLKEA